MVTEIFLTQARRNLSSSCSSCLPFDNNYSAIFFHLFFHILHTIFSVFPPPILLLTKLIRNDNSCFSCIIRTCLLLCLLSVIHFHKAARIQLKSGSHRNLTLSPYPRKNWSFRSQTYGSSISLNRRKQWTPKRKTTSGKQNRAPVRVLQKNLVQNPCLTKSQV